MHEHSTDQQVLRTMLSWARRRERRSSSSSIVLPTSSKISGLTPQPSSYLAKPFRRAIGRLRTVLLQRAANLELSSPRSYFTCTGIPSDSCTSSSAHHSHNLIACRLCQPEDIRLYHAQRDILYAALARGQGSVAGRDQQRKAVRVYTRFVSIFFDVLRSCNLSSVPGVDSFELRNGIVLKRVH